MSAATAIKVKATPDQYYAPAYLIQIENQKLPVDATEDVFEVKVTLDLHEVSSAEFKLSNLDSDTYKLKWSDSEQFRLGSRVYVQLGYVGGLVPMFRGPISTVAPEFLADGGASISVRALDPMSRLKDAKAPKDHKGYKELEDWQIVQEVAERNKLAFKHTKTASSPKHRFISQGDTDDLSFITERALRCDARVFMTTDPKSGECTLHFGPPSDGRGGAPDTTYALAWGTLGLEHHVNPSLIEFKPTMSITDQVRSVTVTGYDQKRKKAIEAKAVTATTPGVLGPPADSGPGTAGRVVDGEGRDDTVSGATVETVEEARALAEALLAERASKFLTATGKVIGLPALRPGDNVAIDGVGQRYGDKWFVTRVIHTLNNAGLITEFAAHKTFAGKKP